MYGSKEAELEVQRTIKRAELTAFLCLLKKWPHQGACQQQRNGLWRGEGTCIDPKACDADLSIKNWEELDLLTLKEILVEVEHFKAHRTEKRTRRTCRIL